MANPKTRIDITAKDLTKSAFKSATANMKKLTGAVFSTKTALVGLAGAAGFGAVIAANLKTIDLLGKTADRLGITTEALGKMRFAASIAGVSSNTLTKALQKMTVGIGEAAAGTGIAKIALDGLGISVKDLEKLSPDEQFAKIAGTLGDLEDNTKRVTAAYEIFGGRGTELLNLAKLGEDGLNALGKEAEVLGLIMSRDTVAGVENANDALTRLGGVFKGFSMQFTAALAPAIKVATDQLKDFLIETANSKGGIKKFAQTMVTDLLQVISASLSAFQGLATAIDFTHSSLIAFGLASEREGISRADTVQKSIDIMDKFIKKVKERNALPEAPTPSSGSATSAISEFVGPQLVEPVQTTIDRLKLQTDALGLSLLTEEEMLIETFSRRSQIVIDAADRDVITEDRKAEILRGLSQKLADDEKKIKEKQAAAEKKLRIAGLKNASGILNSLTTLVGSSSKKQFEIGKKLAKAAVVIDTAAGIMKVIGQGGFAGMVAAVGVAIAGAAQLAQINRTQFGGGGGISAGGVTFPSPTAGNPPASVAPNQPIDVPLGQQSQISITIQGNVIGSEEFVNEVLVPILKEEINNNDTVLINGNSAQALELAS